MWTPLRVSDLSLALLSRLEKSIVQVSSSQRHEAGVTTGLLVTSGGAGEDACRLVGSGTTDVISFLVTSAGNRAFFTGSLKPIPPEPRAFTNLVSMREERCIC